MSYLLIDLEKPALPLQEISPQAGAVLLFTKRKRNRKLAKRFAKTHRAAKVIDVKSGDNVLNQLKIALKQILKAEPTAGIIVASRRKKAARLLDKLLNRYPEAELVLLGKLLPKNQNLISEINIKMEPQPAISEPAVPSEAVEESQKLLQTLESAPVQTADLPPDFRQPDMEKLLNLLKKNRPKKKYALIGLLVNALHLDNGTAADSVNELVRSGAVQIDAAENVKYKS